MAIDPKTGIDTAVTTGTEGNKGLIPSTQQLQKLTPGQLPLQQQTVQSALNSLNNLPKYPEPGPILDLARQRRAEEQPGILRAIYGQSAGGQSPATTQYLLGSEANRFNTGLAALEAQLKGNQTNLEQRQLETLLRHGLASTTEFQHPTEQPGFWKGLFTSAAEKVLPAAGEYAVRGGAEVAKTAWEGFKDWLYKKKGKDADKQQPTDQEIGDYLDTAEGKAALEKSGFTKDQINQMEAALKRPGQQGLSDILSAKQQAEPSLAEKLAGETAVGAAGVLVPEATKKVVDVAKKYGTEISSETAQGIAESGIETGAAAAAGVPFAKIAVLGALAGLGAAAAIRMAYIIGQETTDDFGRGPRLRAEERAEEEVKNKRREERAQTAAEQRSQEAKKAREEAIARGEYANATEYERAQAEKAGKKIQTHEEQQAEINKQNEINKKKKDELDKALEEERKKKEEKKKKKGNK